jgi:hypothetical protein
VALPDPEQRVTVHLCAGRRYRGHELRLIHQGNIRNPEDSQK